MSKSADESERRTAQRRRTKRRTTDEHSTEILESMSDAFVAIDREWRYTYVNRAAERITGLGREEMLGRTVWELFPQEGTQFERACRRAMDEGVTVHFEEYYAPLDTWFEDTVYPSTDGITIYARNITPRKRAEEALREQERFIHQIAELTPVVLNVFDLVTERDTYISSDVFTLLGYTPDEIAQMEDPISPFWHPEDIPIARAHLARSKGAADGEISEFEYRICRRDDEWRWLSSRSMPFARGEQGEVRQIVAATLDITERKRAEEALRRAHEELEQRIVERTEQLTAINAELINEIIERERAEAELLRSEAYLTEGQRLSHTGSGAWNVSTGEVFWSPETYRIYGFDPETAKPSYELFFQIIHPEDRPFVEQSFEEVVSSGSDYEMEFRIIRPDGNVRYIYSVGHPVFNEAGELVELIGTVIDITDRKRAEEALRDEIEERRGIEEERLRLLRRTVIVQEEERGRIAREMHDQFGQQLSALNLKLAILKESCGEQMQLCEQLEQLQAIARQLDADVDFLVWELRPTALDDLGLLAALTNYVKSWSKHFVISAELHTSGMEKDRLTSEIETVLYRIMQEALTNIAKHAGAENVDILLERRNDHISLIVEDDGVGFEAEQAFGAGDKGLGLIGMRERAALVGGTLEIESSMGNGATVVVRIPVPNIPNGAEAL
jgi:PAS domain S-box-containing protein